MRQYVARMQSASSQTEARNAGSTLESAFFPNQVLQPGCATMVTTVLDGLSDASGPGAEESWEVLAQVAAGACGETAADAAVVSEVRGILISSVDAIADRLSAREDEPYDTFVADVADCLLMFADETAAARVVVALRLFGQRGERERSQVSVILNES